MGAVPLSGEITFGYQNTLDLGARLSCKASQHVPCAVRISGTRPPRTSFWSVKVLVRAGGALAFPIDHADVQYVVAEGLQPGQHAVRLAALENEDLFLHMASVPFG